MLACTHFLCHGAVLRLLSRLQWVFAIVFFSLGTVATTCAHAANLLPTIEQIIKGAPNAPYVVRGVKYKPLNADLPFKQRGIASWYGGKFHGRRTANGEVYDKYAFTAAHPTLPLPSYVRVRHIRTGREVIVRVNDRGPFHGRRIIDLSHAAATALGVLNSGTSEVELERLTFDAIRTGRWKSPDAWPDAASEEDLASTASTQASASLSALVDDDAVPVETAGAEAAAPHWLQLGIFSDASQAEELRQSVAEQWGDARDQKPTLVQDGSSTRLLMGPFRDAVQAAMAAREVRTKFQLTALILQ